MRQQILAVIAISVALGGCSPKTERIPSPPESASSTVVVGSRDKDKEVADLPAAILGAAGYAPVDTVREFASLALAMADSETAGSEQTALALFPDTARVTNVFDRQERIKNHLAEMSLMASTKPADGFVISWVEGDARTEKYRLSEAVQHFDIATGTFDVTLAVRRATNLSFGPAEGDPLDLPQVRPIIPASVNTYKPASTEEAKSIENRLSEYGTFKYKLFAQPRKAVLEGNAFVLSYVVAAVEVYDASGKTLVLSTGTK